MNTVVPANFPEQLTTAAFVNGREAAWGQTDCLAAIDWLSKNGFAVLGFELWLPEKDGIRRAIATKAGPTIYVFSCDPVKGETWEDYVRRSALENATHIGSFRWPEDSLERPRPAYFSLTWADKDWFRNSEGKCQTYF